MREVQKRIIGGVVGAGALNISFLTRAFAQGAPDPADYLAQLTGNNVNTALSGANAPAGASILSPANILAGVLFGAIGLSGFIYGKKNTLWRPMILGIALMVFPYVPMATWALYLVGGILTAALFFWRG